MSAKSQPYLACAGDSHPEVKGTQDFIGMERSERNALVPPSLEGIHSKTLSKCLKLHSTASYTDYVFSYTYIPEIKLNV